MFDDPMPCVPDAVGTAAELYQVYHREVLQPGRVGLILNIGVPPEAMRPWFGSFTGPMNTLVCQWTGVGGRPGFTIGPDGWSIYATAPLVDGQTHELSVHVNVAGRAFGGGAAYRIWLTVAG